VPNSSQYEGTKFLAREERLGSKTILVFDFGRERGFIDFFAGLVIPFNVLEIFEIPKS